MIDLKNYGSTNEVKVVDAGEYEVVVSATIQQSKDGTSDYLNLGFKIRDDVVQKYNDGHTIVWTKLFRDKTNPEWFNLTQLGNIIETQEGLDTYKSTFNEVEEFVQYLNGLTLRVRVNKGYDDYAGDDRNSVDNSSWKNPYSKSKHGAYKPVAEEPELKVVPAKEDLKVQEDDELPF